MSSAEFVIWLRGFVKAANTYNITPKQWDAICEELDKVETNKNTYITYKLDNNSSVSLSNLGLTTLDTTYGRPEDSITPTND